MHRHCDSHSVSRSLTEGCCAAANEKSAPEPGREPKTFHDSDELTNFAAAAQQNVRERHCWKQEIAPRSCFSANDGASRRTKFDPRQLRGSGSKIFIDRLPQKWLKVGSSGAKWAIAPCDTWTPIPNQNASMPESSGTPSTRRIGSQSHHAGDAIVLRISFFCPRRHTNFCWSCRQRSSRK